jgi:hypothetical protein
VYDEHRERSKVEQSGEKGGGGESGMMNMDQEQVNEVGKESEWKCRRIKEKGKGEVKEMIKE